MPQKYSKILGELVERVFSDIEKLGAFFSQFDEELDNIKARLGREEYNEFKMLWNYEEKNCREFTLTEAVKWAKINLPDDQGVSAGIFRVGTEDYTGDKQLHQTEFFQFFLKDNRPLLDGSAPHRMIKAQTISGDLTKAFKEKSLLIIK